MVENMPMKEEKIYTTNVEIAKVLGTLSDDEKDVKLDISRNISSGLSEQEEDGEIIDGEMMEADSDSCGEDSADDEKMLHIGELSSEVAEHGN